MAKVKRFSIETRAFVTIWKHHLAKESSNDWKTFVLACFERFTTGNELSNQAYMLNEDKQWKKWSDDKKYSFLSEKCYSKAVIIRRNLGGLTPPVTVELPNGYKNRNGTKSGRVTTEDIANIFGGA
tara:strand:+ start:1614 stop:1991 length:378 start_codon:yes stop_codon:yes gene_type:complete